jgi:hypothetical protein
MALLTLGTSGTTSLFAIQFNHDPLAMSYSDLAAFNALVNKDRTSSDLEAVQLSREGLLYVPGRGTLKVLNGDYVAIDLATGWPILLSGEAVVFGPYIHSAPSVFLATEDGFILTTESGIGLTL